MSAIATDNLPERLLWRLDAQGKLIRRTCNYHWVGIGEGRQSASWDRVNNRMPDVLAGNLLKSWHGVS